MEAVQHACTQMYASFLATLTLHTHMPTHMLPPHTHTDTHSSCNLLLFAHKHFQGLVVYKEIVNINKLDTNKQKGVIAHHIEPRLYHAWTVRDSQRHNQPMSFWHGPRHPAAAQSCEHNAHLSTQTALPVGCSRGAHLPSQSPHYRDSLHWRPTRAVYQMYCPHCCLLQSCAKWHIMNRITKGNTPKDPTPPRALGNSPLVYHRESIDY